MLQAVNPNIKPGIYDGIPNEAYHAGPGISKSGLWTIHKKSPAHYRWPAPREEKAHFDLGSAIHAAILEPDLFETEFVNGPDDRRGNKWKDAQEIAKAERKILLTSADYEKALAVRDAVHSDNWINQVITGGEGSVEASGYWIDPETGVLCRCRPDKLRKDLGICLDIKSARSANADEFARAVVNYGYHSQEAFYSDGLNELGAGIEGFVFLVFEPESPYARAVYELPPAIVEEGRLIMRAALERYAVCRDKNEWPGYPEGVQQLQMPRWSYRLLSQEQIAEYDEA